MKDEITKEIKDKNTKRVISIIYFTLSGKKVAYAIKNILIQEDTQDEVQIFCGAKSLSKEGEAPHITSGAFAQKGFKEGKLLVFVGATGIAVRGIAPYIKSKVTDPAVLVVDDQGVFVISLLSGHLGGANQWTEDIAKGLGATAVVTTATEGHGLFAVDRFAREQGLHLVHPEKIKDCSSALLRGETLSIYSSIPIQIHSKQVLAVDKKEESQIILDTMPHSQILSLIPPIYVVGVGCRKGIGRECVDAFLEEVLQEYQIHPLALCAFASIDVKKEETALVQCAEHYAVPFCVYSSEELEEVEGEFTASQFVASQVGVDNVCERSAVLCSGGELYMKKRTHPKYKGVTLAIARKKFGVDNVVCIK